MWAIMPCKTQPLEPLSCNSDECWLFLSGGATQPNTLPPTINLSTSPLIHLAGFENIVRMDDFPPDQPDPLTSQFIT